MGLPLVYWASRDSGVFTGLDKNIGQQPIMARMAPKRPIIESRGSPASVGFPPVRPMVLYIWALEIVAGQAMPLNLGEYDDLQKECNSKITCIVTFEKAMALSCCESTPLVPDWHLTSTSCVL